MMKILLNIFLILSLNAQAGALFEKAYEHKWEKKKIRICWGNGSQTHMDTCFFKKKSKLKVDYLVDQKHYQKIIQDIVQKEFSQERTGIEFVGWDICPYKSDASTDADVVITIQENSFTTASEVQGDSDQGRGCYRYANYMKDRPGMVSYVRIFLPNETKNTNLMSIDDSVRFIALHELSHSAGLEHEDLGKKKQLRDKSAIYVSRYNPNSIMSYYNYFKVLLKSGLINETIGLSDSDIHSLKCLYVYDEDQRREVCHKKFNIK